jgi:hypothetical protein
MARFRGASTPISLPPSAGRLPWRHRCRRRSGSPPEPSARSRRMPRESSDALENLPKATPRQVAFGKLQSEVPGMPDEAAAPLEEPLLKACQRPTLNGWRQDAPSQKIAEVVCDDPEEQSHLVGTKAVAGEPSPVGGGLALFDPLLGRSALVVEADDGAICAGQGGDDEAHPRKEFPKVMLDLGDHSSRSVPGGSLILETAVSDQWGIAGSHVVGREAISASRPSRSSSSRGSNSPASEVTVAPLNSTRS